jgi:hypothetical protein
VLAAFLSISPLTQADGTPPANTPPTVSLVQPGPDASFTAPARVELAAQVGDADGWVVAVEFFGDEHSLGVAVGDSRTMGPRNPFQWVWEGVPAGKHVLRAKATDNAGGTALSEAVTIMVKEPSPPASIVIRKPVSGARFTAPVDIGIEAVAVDPQSEIRHVEFYAGDRLIGRSDIWTKEATIPGRPREHSSVWTNAPAGHFKLSAKSAEVNAPAVWSAPVEITVEPKLEGTPLVLKGSVWRYLGDGTNLGRDWLVPEFDDSKWPSGPAQLGYGDGDEATVIAAPVPHPITTYFRQSFPMPEGGTFSKLLLRLVRDDGAVVYLNGKELLRDNMPAGDIGFNTLAAATAGDDENAFHAYEVSSSLLVSGRNVIAVEIHQVNVSSSDISFDLELLGIGGPAPPVLPVVSIVASVPETMEPSPTTRVRPGVFVVSRSGATNEALLVWLTFAGSATEGEDYQRISSPVEIPAGQAGVELLVAAIEDDIVEGDETVVATVIQPPTNAAPTYNVAPDRAQAKVVIHDNTVVIEPPVVSVETLDEHASEMAPGTVRELDTAAFRISRTGELTEDLVVSFSLLGTATPGQDYKDPGTSVRIPTGQRAAVVVITALDDQLSEGTETVMLALKAPSDTGPGYYKVSGTAGAGLAYIHDNEGLLRWLRPMEHFWYPADAPVLIRISAIDPLGFFHVVEFFDGEQAIGRSEILTFVEPNPGEEAVHSFVWTNAPAGGHVLTARATSALHQQVVSTPVHILVGDAGDRNVVSIEATDPEASEVISADGTVDVAAFVLRRTGNLRQVLTVLLHAGGTASAGRDYFWGDRHEEVRFDAGQGEARVEIRPIEDAISEGDETVELSIEPPECEDLTLPSCYYVGTHEPARAVIHDSRSPLPLVGIYAPQPTTIEPGPNIDPAAVRFVLTRTGSLEHPLVVWLKYDGTATRGADYAELPTVFVFPQGKAEVSLPLTVRDDLLVEGDETVIAAVVPIPTGDNPNGTDLPSYGIDPAHASAQITIQDNDHPSDHATLEITAPHPGETFPAGATIAIAATAIDPKGYISRVEFWAGDKLLGVSELFFFVAPEPGTPIFHNFEWHDAPAGQHVLTARAHATDGSEVVSSKVPVAVGLRSEQVVLAITATRPVAAELGANGAPELAVLVVKRIGGPKNIEVPVFYSVSGTAQNGVDYSELSGHALLPKNADALELIVKPVADDLVEGEETVVVKLEPPTCIAIFPPPPACYLIGEPGIARAVIVDVPAPPPHELKVAVLAPKTGAVFTLGDPIQIRAAAASPNGQVARLDVYADDHLLDSTKAGELSVKWTDAALGPHVIRARALDERGVAAEAQPVKVLVRGREATAFVHRELPPAYAPGVKFAVALRAEPPAGSHAYAVEDLPPKGWEVSEVSHDGAFDALTGKVKFGPFTDDQARTLSYSLTPAADALGKVEFVGVGSIDGHLYPVAGDRLLEGVSEPHPADQPPADNAISIAELTAYAAAWKQGETWPRGPVPVPIDYVTRAGSLWRAGERYVFDPAKGPPPLCWVSPAPRPQGAGGPEPAGLVRRIIPDHTNPGEPFTVRLPIKPPAGATAYAVEEKLPAGWQVTQASHDGYYDARNNSLRWGVFLDDQERTLVYQVTPPANATSSGVFSGRASYDGAERGIEGAGKVAASDLANAVRFTHVQRHQNGHVGLRLTGRSTQPAVVEVSTDLIHWTPLEPLFLSGDEVDYEDAPADGAAVQRYYRARVQ